jgi:hypothetical protein
LKEVRKAAPSAKEINEAHRRARVSVESAVEHAIHCGQMLIAKRDSMDHGDFRKWVGKNCEFAQSTATRYMKAASQNATAVAFSSLSSLFHSGTYEKSNGSKAPSVPNTSAATAPKSGGALPAAGKPVSADESSPAPGEGSAVPESTKDAPAPQAQSNHRTGVTIESAGESRVASAQSGASFVDSGTQYSDSQLKTIADEFDSDAPELPDDMDAVDRQAAASYERERQSSINQWLEADDKLAAAQKEIERQAAEIATLKSSRDGFMNGKDAITQLLKIEQRKNKRLEGRIKELETENEGLKERIAIMEAA